MTKPKDKKVIKHCSYLTVYKKYTPDELVKAANKMKQHNITGIEFGCEYESPEIFFYRLETSEEANERAELEKARTKQTQISKETYLKEMSKKLGYKLVKIKGEN